MKKTFSQNKGFSTLEMLIAMSILILTLTAVTLTAFGGETMITDSQTNTEALGIAQGLLEKEQLLARKDFKLVNSTTTTETIAGIAYTEAISVSTTTTPDFATKKVKSIVSWKGQNERNLSVTLSAIVTNFDNAIGGDTCDSSVEGHDWKNPHILNLITDFDTLVGTATPTNVITSVDAQKGKLYLALGNTTYKTDPTLFVFDITKLKTDPINSLLGKLDNATSTATGLYAVAVAAGTTTGSMFAYTANENPSNWNTCMPGASNCSQLQIFNVSSPVSMSALSGVNYKIAGITGTSGGVGRSIFYKNGFIYLGLSTATGPEFNIIDVHDPLHPVLVPGGQFEVGASVNSIVVANNRAYLATGDGSRELIVLDVSNPASPSLINSYNAAGGGGGVGLGQIVYKTGDEVYLGRTNVSGSPEFYDLNASTSATNILSLGSFEIGAAVNGLVIRDNLAFLATEGSSGFRVLSLSDRTNINDWAPTLTLPNSSLGSALDCEGNDIFVSSRDALGNNSYLSVISTTP